MVVARRARTHQRRVGREGVRLEVERAEVGVVERLLQLLGPVRIARHRAQLLAEAHPRGDHARLLLPGDVAPLLVCAVEPVLARCAAAREVDLRGGDALRGLHRGVEVLLASRDLVVFDQSLVAAHQLVRLRKRVLGIPGVVLVDHRQAAVGNGHVGLLHELGSVGILGHLLHDVVREREEARLLRAVVEPHDRFEDAQRRQAAVLSREAERRTALGAAFGDQVVAESLRRLQRLGGGRLQGGIAHGVVVVVHQAHERVLRAPHVPSAAIAVRGRVVADVAPRFLRSDDGLRTGGNLRTEAFRAGVACKRRRRVHVLAPELRLPVAFRLLAVEGGELHGVGRLHVVREHLVEPLAEMPVGAHLRTRPRRDEGGRKTE